MNTNSNCKKGINWKKLLFTMLCGVVAFSTMFLTACGKKKDPSDPTPPEVGGDWYTGAELPTANTGSLGDFYFKTDSYQVYKLCNDGWKLIVELSSLLGQEGVSWHYGNDEPSEFVGVPGDYYLDQTDGDIYFSGSNGWEKVYNLMGVSTDQVADGEVAEVYIGYDGYVWIGDSRTTHRPKTIVGANDIVDNTLELKKGYFTSMQLDTTSHAVALMSGYKVVNEGEANEYATTSYSHTTLTNIQFYADADGLLELAVANVKDVLAKVTAGQEIESTTKAVVEVKEGFNNLTVSVVVGYNETLVLGGTNTTSKLYVVTGVTADDDYGVISSVNEGNKKFNATDGIKDKLVLKAKAGAHTILTESYIKTETTHGHPCANCSTVFEVENHTYQNGVCTVCNYSHINHSSTVYDNISSSTHSKICDVCGITYGEGNHTYGEHTSIDYAKHYQECTECGYRLEGTHNYLNATCTDCGYIHVNHLSTNYDNVNNDEHSKVCDVCGQIYALDFHTFNSYTSFDKTKHYRQCSICQYIRYEDHNFLNSTCVDCNYTCTEHEYTNGECTCGATHPCPGNGEFVFVTENTVDDKCIKECSECGLQIELTHNYIDGVCSNCAHSHQAHEYTLGVCDICDFEHQNHSCDTYTKIDNEKHGKTCEVCHVSYDVVDHTLSEYKVYNIHQHYRNCTACDYVVSESHNYIDGTCTICNHTCTSHEYTNGECVCGYDHECDLVNSYTYSSASGDANCLRTCTICNRQTELAHDYENGECANCGHNHTEHNWSNGACTECEVEHDNHTFGEFAYQDSATHGKVCSTCGLVSEIGNHNYVDSTCTICNHTCTSHEWEDGACTNCHITHDCEAGNSFSHANATDDLCIKNCTTCGKAYTNAEHGYYLGTCVYCGHSHVNHIEDGWTVDEDSHYKYCAVCTALLESGEHNLGEIDKNSSDIQNHYRYCSICERGVGEEHTYQDGVCTECDYECEHSFGELKDLNGSEHYRECSICKYQEIENHELNNMCYCTTCGYHDCDTMGWFGGETIDDNTCYTICMECKTRFGIKNHSYSEGVCTDCNYECEHSTEKLVSVNNDTHNCVCTVCNKVLRTENHTFSGDGEKCSCGHSHDCEASNKFQYSPNVEDWCIKECTICGASCKISEEHEWVNGKCFYCEKECEHNFGQYEPIYSGYHGRTCSICGYIDEAEHNLVNCKCTVCNAEEHSMIDCECTLCDYANHRWNAGVCEDCNYECEHDIEGCECTICDYENHSWNYGTCSQCGGSHDCEADGEIYWWNYGDSESGVYCRANCSICLYEWDVDHNFENGTCTQCGYTHENHEYDANHLCTLCKKHDCVTVDKYVIVQNTKYNHAKKCTVCNYVYETLRHTFDENNICTGCSYEHGEHEYYTDITMANEYTHTQQCMVCGHSYDEKHTIYYNKCSVCEWEHYTCVLGDWEFDNVEHSATCEICGRVDYSIHYYKNGDGKCVTCGYECDHDFGWENGLCLNCQCMHENHTFGELEALNENYHGRECSVCGYLEEIAHSFVNCVCTVCEYEKEHNFSWGACSSCGKPHDCANAGSWGPFVYDNEYCSMYCGICYYETIHGHSYVDGKCTCCEHECTHTYSNDEPSYTLGVCNYCKQEHENHEYENGVCVVCGYEHENHELNNMCYCTTCGYHDCDTMGWFGGETIDDNTCYTICMECKTRFGIKNHSYSEGVCTDCNYECEHSTEKLVSVNNDTHNCVCTVCNKVLRTENHTFSGDGEKCSCGHSHDCEASNKFQYSPNVEDWCIKECTICGASCKISEEHEWVNGKCFYCEKECEHNFGQYEPIYSGYHGRTCSICGYIDEAEHNLVNCKCTVCNAEEHSMIDCECTLCDYANHRWNAGVCEDCNYECEHDIEGCECTICDYENHSWNYGTCSQCGGSHVCSKESDYSYYDYGSDDDCRVTCGICYNEWSAGHDYVNGECLNCEHVHSEHLYDENHYCKCGIHNCAEVDNFEIVEYSDVLHAKKCVDCGKVVETNNHTLDANNVCTVCGNEHTTHSYNLYEGSDGIRHFYECLVCEHTYYENHNFDGIGYGAICTVCNIVHDKCVVEEYDRYDYVEHYGDCVCGNSMAGAHSFNNGECTQCDFVCNHIEWSNGKCVNCRKEHENHTFGELEALNENYHGRECSVCGYVEEIAHSFVSCVCTVCEYEKEHEFSWGACISCGKPHDCAGEGTLGRSINGNIFCSEYCSKCYLEKFDGHNYVNGTCTLCEHECTHTNSSDEPSYTLGVCDYCRQEHNPHSMNEFEPLDENKHHRWCEDECGYEIIANHDYIDGICTICFYECVEHEYENCVCVYCKQTNHNYADCECTICGDTIHSFKPVIPEDEENHKKECANCGLILLEGHTFNFSSHQCECGVYHNCQQGDDYRYEYDSPLECRFVCNVCHANSPINHDWVDGTCTLCKHVCEHSASGILVSVNNDIHNIVCIICNKVLESESHTFPPYGNPCACGTYHDCVAGNDYYYAEDGDDVCRLVCNVCHANSPINHDWENGTCSQCHYNHKSHTWVNGTCSSCAVSHNCEADKNCTYKAEDNYTCVSTCKTCGVVKEIEHDYSNSICANCGNVCGHYYFYEHIDGVCVYCYAPHEDHTFVDDYCTVCYKHDCTTVNEFSYTTKDDVICIEKCSVCELSREIEHKYRSASGDCDYCGHYHQNHKNAKPTMSDDSRHSLSCEICGIDLGFEDHNYNVVQENDYEHRKICEDCDHVCFESHKFVDSKCTLCGYECVNHEISNCVCTICGLENHSWNLGTCDDCGEEHEEHEYLGAYEDKGNYHTNECTICGYVLLEEHNYTNYGRWQPGTHYFECDDCYSGYSEPCNYVDCVCTICGEECIEDHTSCECEYCDYENHTWVNGTCSSCAVSHNCEADKNCTYKAEDNYTCVSTCKTCGVVKEIEHDYSNSICANCGNVCGHYYFYEHIDGVCVYCYAPHEDHTFVDDYCTVCYKHNCPTRGNGVSVNLNDEGHEIECLTCQYVTRGSHTYSNGVCTICDYYHDEHDFVDCVCFICGRANHNIIDCECTICDYEEHEWNYGFCSYCQKECDHSSVENIRCTICGYSCYGQIEEHRYDENLFCKICGYHDCEGLGNFTEVAGGTDEACKIINCHVCEKAKNVPHEYVGGSCNTCGYTHENHNWYYTADSYYHYKTCEVCNYDIPDIHDWENSVCTVCEYKCDVPHTDCTCIDCDYENHIYNIGECERCGYKHVNHNFSEYEQDGTSEHRRECSVCGYVEFENHTWDNSKCTVCEYECVNHDYEDGKCLHCEKEE